MIEQKTPLEEKNGTVYYSVKKMWYDGNGNVTKEQILTNSAGEADSYSEVKYTYDNRNTLVMTESNDGETANYTQYYYDAKGNVLRTYTGLTSPLTINGLDDVTAGEDTDYAVTKYTYDKFGRVTQVTDALGNSETNTYDTVLGLLMSTTDRNGQTFNFTYDGMGNLTSKSLADGTNAETTAYGLTGQVLSRQNGNSTISYVYNNKGQLVSESDIATGTTKTYTYDANGNRTGFTLTRNGNTEISQIYAYDKLNRLTEVRENGTVIATYSYDSKGNRVSTVSNGITTEYAYNLANMLTSQTSGNKLTESYTYYLNGNQKSKTSNGQTTNYVYDKMNRLVSENDTVYTFDDFGNRKTMTEGESVTTYTYDLNNRLVESNEVAGDAEINTKYFYDANGNQTTKAVMTSQLYDGASAEHSITESTNESIAIYGYNCYNQLVGVDTNGVVSSYAYLPDGMRLSKTVDGNTTTFVYDGANIVEEVTADGANKYYRGLEIIKNDDNLYYLYNGQGDVAILTDSTGNTVASYIFDAYGNTYSENSVYNCFGYRGEYSDAESGLIYLRARYYDPSIGRFISEDPIRDGYNWYVYCSNNPIRYIDPWGLSEKATYVALVNNPDRVAAMQAWLNYSRNANLSVDGAYGSLTQGAVESYQKSRGFSNNQTDGLAGNYTLSYMGFTQDGYFNEEKFEYWVNVATTKYNYKPKYVGKTNYNIETQVNQKSVIEDAFFKVEEGIVYASKAETSGKYGVLAGEMDTYGLIVEDDTDAFLGYNDKENVTGGEAKVGVSVATAKSNAKGEIGNNAIGIIGNAMGKVLTAEAHAGAGAMIESDNSIKSYLSAGAEAAVATGQLEVGAHIYGYGFNIGIEGSALNAGAKAEIGVYDMKLRAKVKAGVGLFGGGLYIEIGKVR